MNEVPSEIKREILEQKLAQWRQILFSAMTEAKVAARFLDAKIPQAEQMIEQTKGEVKKCEIAIDLLSAEIAGLDGAAQP